MGEEQLLDSQINKELFLLSHCQMKKIMRISASQSTLTDIKVGNEKPDQATTERFRFWNSRFLCPTLLNLLFHLFRLFRGILTVPQSLAFGWSIRPWYIFCSTILRVTHSMAMAFGTSLHFTVALSRPHGTEVEGSLTVQESTYMFL